MKTIKIIILLLTLGVYLLLPKEANAQLRTNSNIVSTKIGNPILGSGWPVKVSSKITQGINGSFDHYSLYAQGLQSIDIANGIGTPIYTTFDGTVTTICNDAQTSCGTYVGCNYNGCGYGKHVVITSTSGGKSFQVFFGHFTEIQVSPGQVVTKGTQLGLMGTTGYSTGPHTHWEFRGLDMSPPNIPIAITPLNCDGDVGTPCNPLYIPTGNEQAPVQSYWFLLHRASQTEVLYTGTPGDTANSTVVRTFNVKTGRPGERPTPLPSLAGREYWIIKDKYPDSNPETAPYFMTLDIDFDAPYYGPTPYTECGGEQCNWLVSGAFGLHGVNGDNSRLGASNPGSSGCIRHTNEDITYLYNTIDPSSSEIRYYIEDN